MYGNGSGRRVRCVCRARRVVGVAVIVVTVDVMMYHVVVVVAVVRVVAITSSVTSSLVVGNIWQGEPQFFPEQFVPPLEVRVGLQVQPDVGVQVFLWHFP